MAGLTPAMEPATAADVVFTTYAAPLHRSEYLVDEGYHLRSYSPLEPLAFTTDTAGDWGVSFRVADFMETQDGDGYIPYRIGPYVVLTFPVKDERASSAPFLTWTNWEVYRWANA